MDMDYVNKLVESAQQEIIRACTTYAWPDRTFTFYIEENGQPWVASNAVDIDNLERTAQEALEEVAVSDFVVVNNPDLTLDANIWLHLEAIVVIERGKLAKVTVDVRTTPEEIMTYLVDAHGLVETQVIDLT